MATPSQSYWDHFWGLPAKDESYFFYIVSFKFIWAPLVTIFSSITNFLWGNSKAEERSAPPSDAGPSSYINALSSILSSSKASTAQAILQRYKECPFDDSMPFGNTPLTAFLAERIFSQDKYKQSESEILAVISDLCNLALEDPTARELLTTANRINIPVGDDKTGVPINTPLMLLVKAGHTEAVRLLLPFYTRDDFMKTTPRRNSVFHIASITGQGAILDLLKLRAVKLGIWSEYSTHKNKRGYTALNMLEALFSEQTKSKLFQNLLDFSDLYLGGEEINKVPVSHFGQAQVFTARSGAKEFYTGLAADEHSAPVVGATPSF